MIGRKYITEF